MSRGRLFVAIYRTYMEGRSAIKKMNNLELEMRWLSFVGRDYRTDDKVLGRYKSSDRNKSWENLDSLDNGIWNLLSGVAFLHIPEMGPFLAGGPLASSIIGILESSTAVKDHSAIGLGLNVIGIPRDKIHKYDRALKADNYLLIVQGTEEEIAEAKAIAKLTDVLEFDLYVVES